MLSIPMRANGGVYVVPVLINDVITRNFVVDSGAADVNLTEDVVLTMMRAGILRDSDFLGERTSMVADGRTVPSHTFRIKSLKVGDRVVENVSGAVSSKGFLLLGQSFLGRFKSWSIDNTKHLLVLQ
jgi:clan AA aspartic protease (TIGR02281 family)